MSEYRKPRRRCIFVSSCERDTPILIEALRAANIEIAEVWVSETQFPKNGFRQPPFLIRPSAARRCVYDLLRDGHNIRVIRKPWLSSLTQALATAPSFDFLLCANSNIIFPKQILDTLPGPALNLHPALLPEYRGAVPIYAMVLNDEADQFGGMTLHLIEPEIDEGAIIGNHHVPRSDFNSPASWMNAVYAAAKPLIVDVLPAFLDGRIKPQLQPTGAGSYYSAKDVPLHAAPSQSYKHIEHYMTRFPQIQKWQKLQLQNRGGLVSFTVATPIERLGPSFGKGANIRRGSVEFDCIDARVRVRRISWLEKNWMKLVRKRPKLVLPPEP